MVKIKRYNFYVLNEGDNVALALSAIRAGEVLHIGDRKVKIIENIPFGFKISLVNIPSGTEVVKDGFPIGVSTEDIPAGALVHVHNLKSRRSQEWVMKE